MYKINDDYVATNESITERCYERYREIDCRTVSIREMVFKEDITLSMITTAMHNSIHLEVY